MKKIWFDKAWNDYLWLQENDKKTLKKLNKVIADIERNGQEDGIGKPEPLKNRDGYWSRRINEKDRIVYKIQDGLLDIISCKGHYDD